MVDLLVTKSVVNPITSDHEQAVHCQVRAEQLKARTKDDGPAFKLNFHKTDITKLKIILKHSDWDNLVYNLPIGEAWEVFYGILHRAVTQTKPFRNNKDIGKRIFLPKSIKSSPGTGRGHIGITKHLEA